MISIQLDSEKFENIHNFIEQDKNFQSTSKGIIPNNSALWTYTIDVLLFVL